MPSSSTIGTSVALTGLAFLVLALGPAVTFSPDHPLHSLLGFGPSSGLHAQSPPGVTEGTRSLSFGIDGSGSGEAGLWIFISERSNLGILGTLDWISEDRESPRSDRTHFSLGLGPRIKWYVAGSPRVAPFWFGGMQFSHTRRTEDDEDDHTTRGLGLEGGFGVDWFPVDQMSVGGWTGLRLTTDRAENDDTTTRLRTLTTGLRVHVYF
jgi:hypothetical protein